MSITVPLASRPLSSFVARDASATLGVADSPGPPSRLRPLPCELWALIAEHVDNDHALGTTRALAQTHPMLDEAARRGQPVPYQAIQSDAAMAILTAPPAPLQPRAHTLFARMRTLSLVGPERPDTAAPSPTWGPGDWAFLRALWPELQALDLSAWHARAPTVARLFVREGAFAHIGVLKLDMMQLGDCDGELETHHLASLPNLYSLTLTARKDAVSAPRTHAAPQRPTTMGPAGVPPELRLDLRSFVRLRALHLDGLGRDVRGLRLPEEGMLEILTLGYNDMTGAWLRAGGVAQCSLKTLTLDGPHCAGDHGEISAQLGQSSSLQALTFTPRRRFLRHLDVQMYHAMHTLCVDDNVVDFSSWTAPNAQALERLSLRATSLGLFNHPAPHFWQLPNLHRLVLSHNALHGWLETLNVQSLPNLRVLDLSHCSLKPEDLTACSLFDAPHLTTLDVRNNLFGGPGIERLCARKMPSLRSVALSFKAKRANSQARVLVAQSNIKKAWPVIKNISVSLHAVTDGVLQETLELFYQTHQLTNDKCNLAEPQSVDELS